jgi:prepilin-type N-terminal cleavage/methylation domain-containing protein
MRHSSQGITFIEIMIALLIIGLLSAVAIPTLLGQRHNARISGDAVATANALRMVMESAKSDQGYYAVGGTYTYTPGTGGNLQTAFPNFQPGNTKMIYTVVLPNKNTTDPVPTSTNKITYLITVTDPGQAGTPTVYTVDDTGASTQPNTP